MFHSKYLFRTDIKTCRDCPPNHVSLLCSGALVAMNFFLASNRKAFDSKKKKQNSPTNAHDNKAIVNWRNLEWNSFLAAHNVCKTNSPKKETRNAFEPRWVIEAHINCFTNPVCWFACSDTRFCFWLHGTRSNRCHHRLRTSYVNALFSLPQLFEQKLRIQDSMLHLANARLQKRNQEQVVPSVVDDRETGKHGRRSLVCQWSLTELRAVIMKALSMDGNCFVWSAKRNNKPDMTYESRSGSSCTQLVSFHTSTVGWCPGGVIALLELPGRNRGVHPRNLLGDKWCCYCQFPRFAQWMSIKGDLLDLNAFSVCLCAITFWIPGKREERVILQQLTGIVLFPFVRSFFPTQAAFLVSSFCPVLSTTSPWVT